MKSAMCSDYNPFLCRFGLWDIAKSLDAVFAMLDTDGNGVLTPEEFLDGFGTAMNPRFGRMRGWLTASKTLKMSCRLEFCGRDTDGQ